MLENKNTILAIVLSALVLIVWQYFVGLPQEKARQQQLQSQQLQQQQAAKTNKSAETAQSAPATKKTPAMNAPAPTTAAPSAPQSAGHAASAPGVASMSRAAAIKATPRVAIRTGSLQGSIDLKGARIDDLSLSQFHESVNPNSPPIVLLSPSGSPHPFYAAFGWTAASGSKIKLPGADTVWKQQGAGVLTVNHPVTMTYDNGAGLEFRRTISVDDKYMFTIKDEMVNKSAAPVTLFPYGLISRHGTPKTLGYYLLHEGLVGYLGNEGLQEYTYKKIREKKAVDFNVTDGWLGFTDKYWAAVLVPDTKVHLKARYSSSKLGNEETYQTDYLLNARTIAPGASTTVEGRLFAGAKEVSVVGINFGYGFDGGYNKSLHLNHFDLLIDWGWFYFITKPMFLAIDWLYRLVGNFGVAILIVTVLIKAAFFPLANKSYASMAKMKAVQPQMAALKERYPDDKAKQQQELMALYKKEKINPLAGCLPIAIQIPVFFSLYKMLFITIEMRHAPFFGWIHDLSAPDPTNLFTLFGLVPWDPTALPMIGHFLHLGLWPLIMGVTMWAQMKLNPTPPDPTQAMIFNWMPLIFTFMLANFPAGLVIYWAWNNSLSVAQQSIIMRKHGAKVELLDNIRALFGKKKTQQ